MGLSQRSPGLTNGLLDDPDISTARPDSPPARSTETTQRRSPRPGTQDTPRASEEEGSPVGVEASRNALHNNRHRAGSAGLSKASRYSIAAPSTTGDDAASDDQEMDVQYDDQIDESLIEQPEMSSPVAPTKRIDQINARQPSQAMSSPGNNTILPADEEDQADVHHGTDPEPMQQEEDDAEEEEEEAPAPRPKAKKGKGKADAKSAAAAKRKPLTDATNKRKGRPRRKDPDDEDDDASDNSAQARKRNRSAKVQREAVHERKQSVTRVVKHRRLTTPW